VRSVTESLHLPLLFLTVTLFGGVRIAEHVRLVPPPLFALVLGLLLFGVLVRGGVVTPERFMNASRTPLENLNGLAVILTTFFASTQIFNLLIPEAGLPFVLFNVFFFVLLLNTFAGSPDRISVLRSLAVIVGSAFILKFILLTALSDPAGGALNRMLLAMLEGITLGTLSQPVLHVATGYIAFATLVLFLIGLALLEPSSRVSFPPAGRAVALIKSDE
jgi:hypothetical protein